MCVCMCMRVFVFPRSYSGREVSARPPQVSERPSERAREREREREEREREEREREERETETEREAERERQRERQRERARARMHLAGLEVAADVAEAVCAAVAGETLDHCVAQLLLELERYLL